MNEEPAMEPTTEPNKVGSINPETDPMLSEAPAIARKPGRPPKAKGPDNASTNYTPSVERNTIDQSAQPAVGGVAGFGDWSDFDESALEDGGEGVWVPEKVVPRMAQLVDKDHDSPAPIKRAPDSDPMFPVRMKRNYRPMSERWFPILTSGKAGRRPRLEDGGSHKIMAGYSILLPLTEAKQLISRGLADRADALPE